MNIVTFLGPQFIVGKRILTFLRPYFVHFWSPFVWIIKWSFLEVTNNMPRYDFFYLIPHTSLSFVLKNIESTVLCAIQLNGARWKHEWIHTYSVRTKWLWVRVSLQWLKEFTTFNEPITYFYLIDVKSFV